VRRAVIAACLAVLALAPAALAAQTPTAPVYDSHGRVVQTPFAPLGPQQHLTQAQATSIFLADRKVHDWLSRYPEKGRTTDATFTSTDGSWTVHVWWGSAGEIARGRVDDATKTVLEAWTGPQVAWSMARGYPGAFGGKELNNPWVWIALSAAFFIGLADLRRLRSFRNLDLLVLLSFGVSLAYFNEGNVFASVPLAYPPMLYLIVRMVFIGFRGRPNNASKPVWPVWVLAAATIFLIGFRIGLNTETSNVIDVGYAGVIGAERIATGQAPYGHMPTALPDQKDCGPPNQDGDVRDKIQTNGRCETANETGDTYGPISYMAYLPGYWIFGWPGRWDSLPAAHFTSIVWDLIAMLGLFLVGRRFGGWRLAVTLAFAWAAYPFTEYASNANTNDAIMPAFLIFGFWAVSSPAARGVSVALAGWTKMAALVVAPLWATYPDGIRRPRPVLIFAGAFLLTTLASFWVLFLEPHPLHEVHVFWERTFVSQFDRHSPFSLWDWGQYHAHGIPDLKWLQRILVVVVAVAAVAFAFFPKRKSPLQLAALTGALLIGFEFVLIHWFYLYIPWFLPFVAFVALAPVALRPREVEPLLPVRTEDRRTLLVGVGAVTLLLFSWALLHFSFWSQAGITDVPVYQYYGDAMAAGHIPYRDFHLEYPPVALPAFLLPTIGKGDSGYRNVFDASMWLCAAAALVAMVVCLRALGRRGPPLYGAVAFAAVAPLLLGSVVRTRFDYLPAALTVGALAALLLERYRVGACVLALGAAAKVYPLVLIPLAVAYAWQRRGRDEAVRCIAVALATLLVLVVPFFLLSPSGVWAAVTLHARRGLQVESLGAALLLAAHQLGNTSLHVVSNSGSQNFAGTGANVVAAAFLVVQLVVIAVLWVSFARGPADPERLVRYFAASVCAFIVLGKVLSPQYMIWLIPLVPLVAGRRGVVATGLLGAALVLTQLWFPTRYWSLVNDFAATASWLVVARDLVLLAIIAVLVLPVREFAWLRVRRRRLELAPQRGT
jgi:uncharacterized membrane protein